MICLLLPKAISRRVRTRHRLLAGQRLSRAGEIAVFVGLAKYYPLSFAKNLRPSKPGYPRPAFDRDNPLDDELYVAPQTDVSVS